MDPKIGTFGQVDIRDLAILGVEKTVFWTFSKLFWSCLGSVQALFSTLKIPTFGCILTPFYTLATHTSCSPLGPRQALKNVDKASSALLAVWVWCGMVGVWCWAYLPLKFFRCLKSSFKNISFFRCLQPLGGTIFAKFLGPTRQKQGLQSENGPKNRHFWPS